MNKAELVSAIANKTNFTKKETEAVVEAFQDVVREALVSGKKVTLVGFGSFDVTERVAREGRNPATGKPMQLSASRTAKFKAGKSLKDALNAK